MHRMGGVSDDHDTCFEHASTPIHIHVLCTAHVQMSPAKVAKTRELNMIWKWKLQQSTSLAELHKTLEAHGYKPWVTNSSIVPHTLGVLTANATNYIILITSIHYRVLGERTCLVYMYASHIYLLPLWAAFTHKGCVFVYFLSFKQTITPSL